MNKKKITYPQSEREFYNKYIQNYFRGSMIKQADYLTVILRAHLLSEILIDIGIKKFTKNDSILKHNDLTYSLKLSLIESLEVLPELIFKAVKRLNSIRNDFAHKINTDLNDVDISIMLKVYEECSDYSETLDQYGDDKKLLLGLALNYLLAKMTNYVF